MGGITHGRVLIGGRRHSFEGEMQGLLEEALIALEARQPLYLAGGFGGIILDMIRALKPEDAAWAPAYADAPAEDPRCIAGLARLTALAGADPSADLGNGLSDAESRRLAATHRPSEIAALVSLGLGRLAAQDRFRP